MTEEFLALIVGEIREDYQIPPYTDDYVIMRSVENARPVWNPCAPVPILKMTRWGGRI